jgi:dephospho-CoA kinase
MLRVGLTGGLGSGKSTVAAMLRSLGAEVIAADELGRALMEPGQAVFSAIVEHFGAEVVGPDGRLNRKRLAELAFHEKRVDELSGLVHPAVIAAEERWMEQLFARNPAAVAVVESALIFEVERDARARGEIMRLLADWRRRMDRIVLVTAPDELKIARFAARVCPEGEGRAAGVPSDRSSSQEWEDAEAEARRRLAYQIPDEEKADLSDYVIDNAGNNEDLRAQVEQLWPRLQAESNKSSANTSLE